MGKRKRGGAFEIVPAAQDAEADHDMHERPHKPTHDNDDDDDDNDNDNTQPQQDNDHTAQPPMDDTGSDLPAYFLSLPDFTSQLTHTDPTTIESALARFIAQVKGEYTEHKADPDPAPGQPPSPLLAAYVSASPQAHELFALLGRPSASYTLTAKLLDALHLILSPRFHPRAAPPLPVLAGLARRFLRSHVRLLYRLLGLQDTRLPAVALRLLSALCGLSHDVLRDTVHALDLHNKALLGVATRVTAAQGGKGGEGKAGSGLGVGEAREKRLQQLQRLRGAYLSLFLQLVRSADSDVLTTVLSAPPYVTSVVRGLKADDVETVRGVLEALVGVLDVRGISDELRYTSLFSSHTLDVLTRLYVDDEREGGRLAGVLYDFFVSLLRAVRSEHAWSVEHREFSRWKYHKQLLSRLLSSLHPTASSHQQQLTLSILSSFPSLLPSYLTHLNVAFEPRLSTRYVANVALVCHLLAVPLSVSHLQFLASECQSAGQYTQLVMSHLLPTTLTKLLLSQSIQHPNLLVQLTALTLLSTLLTRYHHITSHLSSAASADTEYQIELAAELRRRLPDVQVVFGLRAKLFAAAETNGIGAASDVEAEDVGRRVELYGRVLDVLALYQRFVVADDAVAGAASRVDMWKLLLTPAPFTWQTTQKLLTLLSTCTNSPRLFHLPQRLVKEESKLDEEQEKQIKPTSYFGHLLSLLLHCRQQAHNSPEAASIVHRHIMELIATALTRAGTFTPSAATHRVELVALLSLLTPTAVPFLEHIVALTQFKPPTTTALSSFPLLRSALFGRAWVGSAREYEHVSGYICAVLGRLLFCVNRHDELAAGTMEMINNATAVEAGMEEADDEKASRTLRNGLVQQLLSDHRFVLVAEGAATVAGVETLNLPTVSARHDGVKPFPTGNEEFAERLPEFMRAALASDSHRHALLLYLSGSLDLPLLISDWIMQHLSASELSEESVAVQALVSSIPPSILIDPDQLPDCIPAVTFLCDKWAREEPSEAERLVLLTELTSVLAYTLYSVEAGHLDGASIIVPLSSMLSLVQALVLSDRQTSEQVLHSRLSAVCLTVAEQGKKRLFNFFLSSSPKLPAYISATVTTTLASLIQSALGANSSSDLQSLFEPFLARLVNSCVELVHLSPPSTVPLPFLALASLSSHLTPNQLSSIAAELLRSPAAGEWLLLLSRQGKLASVLLSQSPARAFAVIAEQLAAMNDAMDHEDQRALDQLTLDLLQPSQAITSASAMRASLVPEQLFTALLSLASETRLQLITALLSSTASVKYVQPFAAFVVSGAAGAELSPVLPAFIAYLRATAALPSTLLPDSHSAVIAFLTQTLRKHHLPNMINAGGMEEAEIQQVQQLVKTMVDAGAFPESELMATLGLLLATGATEEEDEQKQQSAVKRRGGKVTISRSVFPIVCGLLASPCTVGQVLARASYASMFLMRVLNTLMAHFKTDLTSGDSAALQYEAMLLTAAIALLNGSGALPQIDLLAEHAADEVNTIPGEPARHSKLFTYGHLLSLRSLAAVASPSAVSKILTRFFTSALRSRFDVPDAHKLLFLLFQLQLESGDRNRISCHLSFQPWTVLAEPKPLKTVLKVLDPAGVDVLNAHTLFDLIVSHSHFLPALLPALSPSTDASLPFASTPAQSLRLRHAILDVLYLLFKFPVSPAPIPAPSSFLSVLTSVYTGTNAPLDVKALALLSLLASSSSSSSTTVINSRTRWGEVGQQQLRSLIASGEGSTASVRLDDDSMWLYTAFSASQLQRGPLLSTAVLHIPPSLTTLSVFAPQDSKHKQPREETASANAGTGDVLSSHYSPHLVLPFFLHLFRHTQPELRRLIDQGVLAYALHSLSHPLLVVRKSAYKLIAKFYSEMERTQAAEDKLQAERTAQREQKEDNTTTANATTPSDYHDPKRQRTLNGHATFKEQPELLFLLTTLRNSITTPHMHVSCIVTSFLAAASTILLHPSHSLYRPINRFLTLSPSLPLHSVPLFHDLLLSRRPDEWRRDRAWLLRWLHDAAAGGGVKEWHVLRRRRVLSALMVFHDSRHADRYTRTLVLGVLKRVAVMGRAGGVAVEGEEAEGKAGAGVALAGLVRNCGLLVWLRHMVANQELGLATLVPALELALLVVREVRSRLPDEAPKLEEEEADVEKESMQVDISDAEDSDDSDSDSAEISDIDDTAAEGVVSHTNGKHAVIDTDDEDEALEQETRDESAAGRLKAARSLSRRRIGLAQDMQLLAGSLVQRLAQTLKQQAGAESQSVALLSEEKSASGNKVDGATETSQLGFGNSSASSLSASLPTISLCLSLLHALTVTARKARTASGIEQSTSNFSALLSSAGCLEVSLTPSQAALLCSSAAQLSGSNRADVFQSITHSAVIPPLDLEAGWESERQAAVSVLQWTHDHVMAADSADGASRGLVTQWLSWVSTLLQQPQVRGWLVASEEVLVRALLSLYPLLMLPARQVPPTATMSRLNRILLQFDGLLPSDQQLSHRLQASTQHKALRLSYNELQAEHGRVVGSDQVMAWNREVRASILLHDVWLVALTKDASPHDGATLQQKHSDQNGKPHGSNSSRTNGAKGRRK